MISFAHPAFLWGLTALSLPLAIHLLSRKEGKVIYIGSLRHLIESNTRQSLNIRLNELLLLVLRMLAIAMLVFYISGLRWPQNSSTKINWLVIEKGLERNSRLSAVFDSLLHEGYEAHFLSPGFPLLEDSINVTPLVSYWEMAKTLQTRELNGAKVFSFNRMELFRGSRPSLPPEVQWIACDVEPHQFPVQGTILGDNKQAIRTGYSSAAATRFETLRISDAGRSYFKLPDSPDSVFLAPPDTIRIWLPAEEPFSRDAHVLQAALGSLQEIIPQTQLLIDFKPALKKYDWIFQFAPESRPDISTNAKVIFKPSSSSSLFIQSGVHEWQLTRRLTQGIALKENLSIRLSQILIPADEARAIALANDRRTMDGKLAWAPGSSSNTGMAKAALYAEGTDNLLMFLLVMVIMIERVISHYRNQ